MKNLLLCLFAIFLSCLSSCVATTGDLDASRALDAKTFKALTLNTAKLQTGELSPTEFVSTMKDEIDASAGEWKDRVPDSTNWLNVLGIALGPAAAAGVYGVREWQRRKDIAQSLRPPVASTTQTV